MAWRTENHTQATFPTKNGRLLPRTWRSCERTLHSATPRFARGVQWNEVDRAHRLCLALYATRPASVGGRLSTNAAMATGRSVRGDGPRFAHAVAPFGGQSARSD